MPTVVQAAPMNARHVLITGFDGPGVSIFIRCEASAGIPLWLQNTKPGTYETAFLDPAELEEIYRRRERDIDAIG